MHTTIHVWCIGEHVAVFTLFSFSFCSCFCGCMRGVGVMERVFLSGKIKHISHTRVHGLIKTSCVQAVKYVCRCKSSTLTVVCCSWSEPEECDSLQAVHLVWWLSCICVVVYWTVCLFEVCFCFLYFYSDYFKLAHHYDTKPTLTLRPRHN